jgi:hypothetical protein
VPSTFAYGLVLDYKEITGDGEPDASLMWVIDFGAQYSVQRIRATDYELIRPRPQRSTREGEGGTISPSVEEWAPMEEGAAANQVQCR